MEQHVLAVELCRERGGQRRGGVHHEQIPGPQEAAQVGEAGVSDAAISAARHEQRHVGAARFVDLRQLLRLERLGDGRLDHRSAPRTSLAR